MKILVLISLLAAFLPCRGQTLTTKEAASDLFKVSFVEPSVMPPLTEISEKFDGRQEALDLEKRLIEAGVDARELERHRRESLRRFHYPIQVADSKTGMIYEVQKDHRTIIARSKDGKVLWEANPFVDAKLKPYRVDHPFIVYLGRITWTVKPEVAERFLQVNFNSSQFGRIDLKDGSFTLMGQD